MKVSAIILNYRGAERTAACLRSLAGQGLSDVLVVDNSADEPASRELSIALQRFRSELPDFALHLINPGRNLGFSCGVNLGLNEAAVRDSDAFLLINNDAVATPGMVARLAEAMEKEAADLVTPTIIDDGSRPQSVCWYQRFFGMLLTSPLPFSFSYPSGCCLLFHRELLMDGKLFDEDFFMYGEDTLLGWRLIQAGKKMNRLDDVFVHHSGVGSSHQYGMFYEYHTARAHILLAQKTWHYPVEIPLLLITKGAGLALRALLRSLRSGSIVPLRALVLAWWKLDIRTP